MGGAHRSGPGSVSAVPIRCRNRCRGHSPDASLLAADASATAVAWRHDDALHGGCVDSALRLDAQTRAAGSAHTLLHNRCCRDRNGCRSAPAPHNAGSCRADSSARPAPAMPLPKHWTVLGQGRHKGPAQAPFPGTAHRGLGGSDANLETLGPRFFDLSPRAYRRRFSAPRWHQTTPRSSAAVGGRPRYSERREKESVIRTDTDQINQPRIARDNQRLKSAPIARNARISTAINITVHSMSKVPDC
jgi:hypothetical protein